jgi:hypothetical protein
MEHHSQPELHTNPVVISVQHKRILTHFRMQITPASIVGFNKAHHYDAEMRWWVVTENISNMEKDKICNEKTQ